MSHTEWDRALSPLAPASLAKGRKRLEAPDLMLWSPPDSSGNRPGAMNHASEVRSPCPRIKKDSVPPIHVHLHSPLARTGCLL
jgi:hypothetical protein